MQEVAQQHRAGVDVEHLLDAVVGVVVEEFVKPLEGIVVGLPDAAEVAGDRLRPAQVDVGAVGALGVQRLHVAGADDLHGSRHGQDVAVVGLLLLHLADADKATGH